MGKVPDEGRLAPGRPEAAGPPPGPVGPDLAADAASAWPGAWTADVEGATLWVGDIDGPAASLPLPNAVDLADAGRRSGEALRLFLRRRVLLRALVGRRCGADPAFVVIGYDARGAPVLRTRPIGPGGGRPGRRLFVSVAGRGPLAAFALAHDPVGIDVEPETDPGPLDAVLTEAERLRIAAGAAPDRPQMRLRSWTAKEAYLKALGTGLRRDPARVEVVGTGDGFEILERRSAEGPGRGLGRRSPPARGCWFRLKLQDSPLLVALCRRGS